MGSLLFDLRDAFRSLRRDRTYAAAVSLTLALTLGATTGVFSIVNGVLLEPLAFRESHRLVAVGEIWREFASRIPVLPVNERHFEFWRTHAKSFESLAQYIVRPASLTGSGEAAEVTLVESSGSLFDVLQVNTATGRTLTPDDERPERPRAAVVTDACWRQRLGADPEVLRRTVILDGKAFAVVGVLAPGFQLPTQHRLTPKVDAFIAMRVEADQVGWVGDHNNEAIGRLRETATLEQARAELDVLQAEVGATATKEAHQAITLAASITPLTDSIVGGARRGLLLLLAAIGAVLLIACSNLANLSLTRTLARGRDAAIRAALGATRARLLSRLLVEHLALAAVGGVAGLAVAQAAIATFVRTAPVDLPRASEVALDGRVLAFAGVAAIVAGLGVALIPAWHLASGAARDRLRASGLATTDSRGGLAARRTLLAAQVALSVTLLAVTGLLTASFARLVRSDTGFVARQALALDVVLPATRYPETAQRADLSDRVLEGVRAVPGVTAVAWTHILPLSGEGTVNLLSVEGDRRPWAVQPTANYRFVSADLFRALSIPLKRGRTFLDSDRDLPTVPGVVTTRTAAQMWPNVDPIGRQFRWSPNATAKPVVVVGVVAETKTYIDGQPPLMVYLPYWYQPRPRTSLVVRTSVDPGSVTSGVRRAIHAADPEIAIADARPMEEMVDAALGVRRYQMWLFAAFGAMALVIAAVGVYGVTEYGVSRRRREMNIRVALGSPVSRALGLVVRQVLSPVAIGLVAGTAGAAALGTTVASLLFEVRPRDPLVLGVVLALVGSVAVVACLVAARRGLIINPAAALREE